MPLDRYKIGDLVWVSYLQIPSKERRVLFDTPTPNVLINSFLGPASLGIVIDIKDFHDPWYKGQSDFTHEYRVKTVFGGTVTAFKHDLKIAEAIDG